MNLKVTVNAVILVSNIHVVVVESVMIILVNVAESAAVIRVNVVTSVERQTVVVVDGATHIHANAVMNAVNRKGIVDVAESVKVIHVNAVIVAVNRTNIVDAVNMKKHHQYINGFGIRGENSK
ncbi:hypothetical protein NST14_24840 [Bacillus sp. FSL W8-0519]|uniref:hypothetical protein n=1 Tax=Bacillus TaxID=1386 RepID=UPI001E4B89EE|nr:hypothetical protein [Bacillus paranthracis]MCC2412204.1 hypothetical protein [Bacillus paranthracis]